MRFVIVWMISLAAWGQTQYALQGSYQIVGKPTGNVVYSLKWSEDQNSIVGKYSDNFFSKDAVVTGTVSKLGRTFQIEIKRSKLGVKSLTILSANSSVLDTATTVPVTIVTRDQTGNPLSNIAVNSQFIIQAITAQREEESCQEGFGELGGFCGIYSGVIVEESDPLNKCRLLSADAARFEMNEEGSIFFHLGEVNSLIVTAAHPIGRIPVSPGSKKIDVISRSCRPLSSVGFPGDDCKLLNISGSFSDAGDSKKFTGIYTITNEENNQRCRFTLSMDQR